MSSSQVKKYGLRELSDATFIRNESLYTHLVADDGTRFRLFGPITDSELQLLVLANNCLLIVMPKDTHPLASVSVYSTARITGYGMERASPVGEDVPESRYMTWVQTQNQKYWLVKQ